MRDLDRAATTEKGHPMPANRHRSSLLLVQSFEVEKTSIQDFENLGLWQQLIEDVAFVPLAVGDMDETRDIPTQIEQRLKFDGRLGGAERSSSCSLSTPSDQNPFFLDPIRRKCALLLCLNNEENAKWMLPEFRFWRHALGGRN